MLENHADVPAADLDHAGRRGCRQVLAVERDLAQARLHQAAEAA